MTLDECIVTYRELAAKGGRALGCDGNDSACALLWLTELQRWRRANGGNLPALGDFQGLIDQSMEFAGYLADMVLEHEKLL